MIAELIVTSAPRGLQAGRSGFTTVLRTRGIHPDLATRLESSSGYRHVYPQGDARNPVIFSCVQRQSAVGEVWVLSRVGDAGSDYTGRSNKIAHHFALQQSDIAGLASSNPAAVMMALDDAGLLTKHWSGEPREVAAPSRIPAPLVAPGLCSRWADASGDAGWAGYLVERALRHESTWIIAPPTTNLLTLFSEALALVAPAQRWRVPFTTFSLTGDEGRWLGTVAGTAEAEAAAAQQRMPVIDLRKRSMAPSTGAFVLAARGEGPLPWQRTEAMASVPTADVSGLGPRQPRQPSGERGVRVPPPMQKAPPTPWPPVGSRVDGSSHEGLPPLSASARLRKRIMIAVGAVAVTLLLLVAPLAAYWLDMLPAGWRREIDTWAWRVQLRTEQPEEVVKAQAVAKQIDTAVSQLEALLAGAPIEAHPRLPGQQNQLLAAKKGLDALLSEADKLRKLDFGKDLYPSVEKADEALRDVRWALGESAKPLVNMHLKCIAALSAEPADGGADDKRQAVKEAREKLLEGLREHSKPEQMNSLADLLAAYGKAQKASESDAKPTPKERVTPVERNIGPKAIDLLANAVRSRKRMPSVSLLIPDAGNGKEVTIVEWPEKAGVASLTDVELAFPKGVDDEGPLVALKRVAGKKDQLVEWECLIGKEGSSCGSFRLSQTALRFQPAANTEPYPWQFLPLLIGRKAEPEKFDTWMQLVSPTRVPELEVGNGKPGKVTVVEGLFSEGRDGVLSKIFESENLKWRSLVVKTGIGGNAALPMQIGPRNAESLSNKLAIDTLPAELWWRLTPLDITAEGFVPYHENLAVSQNIVVGNGNAAAYLVVNFEVDDFLEVVNKKSVISLLERFRKAKDGVARRDFFEFLNRYAGYVLTLSDGQWPDVKDVQKRMDIFQKTVTKPSGKNEKEKKSFDALIQDMRLYIQNLPDMHALITQQVFERGDYGGVEPKYPGEPPKKPDETADPTAKKDYENKKTNWDEKNKLWEQFNTSRSEHLSDDAAFHLLVEEQLANPACELGTKVIMKLWYDLYRYHRIASHKLAYASVKGESDEAGTPIQDVANAALLRVTGDLVLDWSKSAGLVPRSPDEPAPVVVLVNVFGDGGSAGRQAAEAGREAPPAAHTKGSP